MNKPEIDITIDPDEGTIRIGNDDIGNCEFRAPDSSEVEWAERLRDFLEEHGITVNFDDGE
jgi:hypothetical protein